VLQHPRESRQTFGTARILLKVLPQVELHVGVEFSCNQVQALDDPRRPPMLLFPGPCAETLRPGETPNPRTIVVLDATWPRARQMLVANEWLRGVPMERLALNRPSLYGLREQPLPEGLCTLEAVAEAVAMLDGNTAVRDALTRPLLAMNGFQEASLATRSSAELVNRARLVREGYLPDSR
jgi:DTW domain-containing protein YfiP